MRKEEETLCLSVRSFGALALSQHLPWGVCRCYLEGGYEEKASARCKQQNDGCTYSFSPSSKVYDAAIARCSPVELNDIALTLVSKAGSWEMRFLFLPSHMLTLPSPPPVANVP